MHPALVASAAAVRGNPPRLAVVNSMPFHLEVVAGLVDAAAAMQLSAAFFLNPAVWPGAERDLGFLPWVQNAICE